MTFEKENKYLSIIDKQDNTMYKTNKVYLLLYLIWCEQRKKMYLFNNLILIEVTFTMET